MATKAQLRRSSKYKGHYAAQFAVTKRNKARRAARSARRRQHWRDRGTKKNGDPVLT